MPTCFVIQPFDKGPYDRRYDDVLKPAILDADLEPYRVDQDPSVTVPIDDIENQIRESEICLADISTNNPNVWYEVGYAFANGKPVVLICAEPRLEAYPFDIRHRHIIPYATQSPSDFEKLRREVTARLKAQAKKAEKLQTAVAMSQIKPTEGLSQQEMTVLITIMSSASTPYEGVQPHKIKESMKRGGYMSMASTLAMAGLKQKDMIEFNEVSNDFNERYTICSLTEKGITWMLENQDRFRMRFDEEPEPPEPLEPAPKEITPITDEDIPF